MKANFWFPGVCWVSASIVLRSILSCSAVTECPDQVARGIGPAFRDQVEVEDVGAESAREHILALAADQAVVAVAAAQEIGAGRADDDIVEPIADPVDGRSEERQVLHHPPDAHRIRQAEVEPRLHGVAAGAAGDGLVDDVADMVDDVSVGAGEARHDVGAAGAIEHIGGRCCR